MKRTKCQLTTKMRIKNDSRAEFLIIHSRKNTICFTFGNMSGWLLRGSIILWSSSKFLVGTGMALAFLSPFEGLIWCLIGGIGGCLIWIFAGNGLQQLWVKHVSKAKKKVIFSKKNRFLVKIRSRGGLWLVAFLTPLVLSIPVGCLFANTLESNPYRVLRIQSLSVVFWSVLIFGFKGIAVYFKAN